MLHLSYIAARARATGEIHILQLAGAVAAGRDNAEVAACYREFVAPDENGAELRATFSHVLFVIDNNVRGHHEFADPALERADHLNQLLAAAKADHAAAVARAAQAADLAKAAKAATGEQK